jgi:hypothetical protein
MKRIVWFFCLYPLILSAQESDIFKQILKETLRPELSADYSSDFPDSIFLKTPIRLDATKRYIPRLGFNHNENLLLLFAMENFTYLKPQTLPPNLFAPYTNQKKFDLNSTETTGDVVANVILTPLAAIIMINPMVLFDYLTRAGILPNDPFVPKKSKKERMLKTITKDVYHIDDY